MGTSTGLGHGGGTKINGVLQPPSSGRQSEPPARGGARDSATLCAQAAQPRPAAPRGAGRSDARAELLPGRLVAGRYKLVHPLGRGAMGEVWRAHDRVLRIDVALKFLTLPRHNLAIDAMERFRFEAQVAAQLARKTDLIVTVHDAGEDPVVGPYLVMEHVRGQSLRQLIQERGPVPPAELAALLGQIGEALSVAHGLGIVHRDIKPSNLLLLEGRDGRLRAKVADFGIAKWIRQDLAADFPRQTAEGVVLGTPAYLSPEHTCEGHADPQLDMWALAVVAHVALTGQQPFAGRTMADVLASVLASARPPLSTLCPGAPPELETWFARAFALDPEERFPSIKPMIAAFMAAVGVSEVPVARAPAARARRTRLHLAAAGLLVALGLGLALTTALPSRRSEAAVALQPVSGEVHAAVRRAAAAEAAQAPRAFLAAACSAVPPAGPVPAPPPAAPPPAAAPPVATPTEPAPRPATEASPSGSSRPVRAAEAPRSTGGAPPRKRATDAGRWKSSIF
ncbi:protein kinase [Sorangium cellulosum]|uniref:Protein kinase n=1 Tax=Sorangium cellulosum TaxID=56 RepID=A0A2L0F4Y9_SORCE|nr:serine/threonine-protein kinase [Sorangium cellulosum]AUX46561.1 protein kinase [Sorangium cellulosum]